MNNLNAGQAASETFTVATTDGGSATVTVNITGSEDVSTLTSATANLTETNAVLSTGGTLSLTDLDATAATVVAQTGRVLMARWLQTCGSALDGHQRIYEVPPCPPIKLSLTSGSGLMSVRSR